MSLLASDIQNKVGSCHEALEALEQHLKPMLETDLASVQRHLSALENAELQVAMLYGVVSSYFTYLLTQGHDLTGHPIRQELDRIQMYFKKVKAAKEEAEAKAEAVYRTTVDTEAAQRIVKHYTAAAEAASVRQRGR
eukprot:CAMPEP_0194764272 /NCGR_PEP_ID=MMETSP0323_2-20130528/21997_1 /TAXON_ID=2866 ORGANISM="Crypthecodinium cohnii, Strain Seligo" /NCGR_SAMPLE_ID=MMETSP0323_2 /ASSEMBLY_ACC=CAM_ASM_000346 /LENGTH=136 /DNA_ID=CAMNT_0039691035 /DNA_START=110 /DNA_END=520 /DNA_ORIENTATION=+